MPSTCSDCGEAVYRRELSQLIGASEIAFVLFRYNFGDDCGRPRPGDRAQFECSLMDIEVVL